ncbi:hypothetical protein Y1Q_0022644 [Alligator mississippiensis]|uniref:Uncharacterized protein n=1 Tax=Alligator mississippiensis TaxID=8496 RepID=A0A151PHR2_ALLMI|nr:hypothetical protein Y1Q_0022644 [Alligator mississippiensis]
MKARRRTWDWTQCQSKIKALKCVKDENSRSGAVHTIGPFYDQLSIILSKDVDKASCLQVFGSGVVLDSTPNEGTTECPETETVSMLEPCCLLMLDDRDGQEEVTLILNPVSLTPSPINASDHLLGASDHQLMHWLMHQKFLRPKDWFWFLRRKKMHSQGLLPHPMEARDVRPNLGLQLGNRANTGILPQAVTLQREHDFGGGHTILSDCHSDRWDEIWEGAQGR